MLHNICMLTVYDGLSRVPITYNQIKSLSLKAAMCKNWPPAEFILQTNRGQHVAAVSQLAQLAVQLAVQDGVLGAGQMRASWLAC